MSLLEGARRGTRERSKSLAVRIRAAQALADQRRIEEAEAAYQSVLADAPDSWIAANNLGALHAREGDLQTALAHYLRAWEYSREHEAVAVNLADAYLRMGRHSDTVATCTQALGRGCRSGPVYHALIEASARLHKYDLAAATIEEYRPLIRDQQEFLTVNLTLLECYVAQGRTVGVPQIAEDLLALSGPDRPERWLRLARLLRQAGCPDLAFRTLARIRRVTPACSDLEFDLYQDFEDIEGLVRDVYSSNEEEANRAFRQLSRFRTEKIANALQPLARLDGTVLGKQAKDYLERVERDRERDAGPPRFFTSFAPTFLPPIVVLPLDDDDGESAAGGAEPGLRWQFSVPEPASDDTTRAGVRGRHATDSPLVAWILVLLGILSLLLLPLF